MRDFLLISGLTIEQQQPLATGASAAGAGAGNTVVEKANLTSKVE